MAYEESIRSITLNADASLGIWTGVPGALGSPTDNAQKQYHLVKVTGSHQCGLVSGATDAVVGVLQNKPQQAGAAATVAIRGVSKVVPSLAVTAGDKVYAAADGRVNKTNTGTYVGIALATTANAGELLPVLLML